jgi:hypothetical protein
MKHAVCLDLLSLIAWKRIQQRRIGTRLRKDMTVCSSHTKRDVIEKRLVIRLLNLRCKLETYLLCHAFVSLGLSP